MSHSAPGSPTSGGRGAQHTRRESSALLKFDMRLPARVKAEVDAGRPHARVVRDFVDKAVIRPQLVETGRHECLRRYFDNMDKDHDGTLDLHEMRRWLPVIGTDNPAMGKAVEEHFKFMDKDGSDIVRRTPSPLLSTQALCFSSNAHSRHPHRTPPSLPPLPTP